MSKLATKLKLNQSTTFKAERHGFHIVRPSPWPFLTSISLLNIILGILFVFNDFEISNTRLLLNFIFFFLVIGMWFRDIVIEATFQGYHTSMVQRNLRTGMITFLLSETMFFFGFFWCYFYMSVSPSIWIGCTWPPIGIQPIDPSGVPLLNTILLVSSGVCVNLAHKAMLNKQGRKDVFLGLGTSISLGILFTLMQYFEYTVSTFSINDSIYGSIIFLATGFHGLHVIIGTIALIVCFIRHYYYHFEIDHHLGFEFSIWYWHFVDITWLLLYLIFYCWGYNY
jgi:heme/copper-type cytochrome/quinol oxidase subunit 3